MTGEARDGRVRYAKARCKLLDRHDQKLGRVGRDEVDDGVFRLRVGHALFEQ